jgi:hypothetical protein
LPDRLIAWPIATGPACPEGEDCPVCEPVEEPEERDADDDRDPALEESRIRHGSMDDRGFWGFPTAYNAVGRRAALRAYHLAQLDDPCPDCGTTTGEHDEDCGGPHLEELTYHYEPARPLAEVAHG